MGADVVTLYHLFIYNEGGWMYVYTSRHRKSLAYIARDKITLPDVERVKIAQTDVFLVPTKYDIVKEDRQ